MSLRLFTQETAKGSAINTPKSKHIWFKITKTICPICLFRDHNKTNKSQEMFEKTWNPEYIVVMKPVVLVVKLSKIIVKPSNQLYAFKNAMTVNKASEAKQHQQLFEGQTYKR